VARFEKLRSTQPTVRLYSEATISGKYNRITILHLLIEQGGEGLFAEQFTNVKFADDTWLIDLLAGNLELFVPAIDHMTQAYLESNVKENASKRVSGLLRELNTKLLGCMTDLDADTEFRVQRAWRAVHTAIKKVSYLRWYSRQAKAAIVIALVRSSLLYGSVSRPFSEKEVRELEVVENTMIIRSMGTNLERMKLDGVSLLDYKLFLRIVPMPLEITSRKLKYFGHTLRANTLATRGLFGVFLPPLRPGADLSAYYYERADAVRERPLLLEEHMRPFKAMGIESLTGFFASRDPVVKGLYHQVTMSYVAEKMVDCFLRVCDTGDRLESLSDWIRKKFNLSDTNSGAIRELRELHAGQYVPADGVVSPMSRHHALAAASSRYSAQQRKEIRAELANFDFIRIKGAQKLSYCDARKRPLFDFKFVCQKCEGRTLTIAACATENYILEHARRHNQLQVMSIYKKGSIYVSDHRSAISTFRPIPYWLKLKTNAGYSLVKHIPPEEYRDGTELKCRFCTKVYCGKATLRSSRFRTDFAVSIRRHEVCVHTAGWRWESVVAQLRTRVRRKFLEAYLRDQGPNGRPPAGENPVV
jgi:hypothetical protein